jgi:CheY-like chemotaxis protein
MMQPPLILLVEDNPDDRALILRSLRKHNLVNPVEVAEDGALALEYLLGTGGPGGERRTLPSVVVLDLKLPKIDGLEVLRRIRAEERTKLIPVIILTSSNEDKDVASAYATGANSYVRKPVDFAEFSEAVRQLGLYWLLLNEPPPQVRT